MWIAFSPYTVKKKDRLYTDFIGFNKFIRKNNSTTIIITIAILDHLIHFMSL
jgi:hypothetical protein